MANPSRADGVTLLDEVWAAAPFRVEGHLIPHVRATAAWWASTGLLTADDARDEAVAASEPDRLGHTRPVGLGGGREDVFPTACNGSAGFPVEGRDHEPSGRSGESRWSSVSTWSGSVRR